ncbi:hypothetical protein DICA0_E21946 [Diutina catenulata]
MIIEGSANDQCLRTLNLGCFPRDVVDGHYAESAQLFDRLVHVDFHIHELIRTEFNGDELPDDSHVSPQIKAQLDQLFDTLEVGGAAGLDYDESLYLAVVKAHLCFLDGRMDEMKRVLTSITVSNSTSAAQMASASIHQVEFILYLTVRYYVLLGLTNYKYWIEYLATFPESFVKSQVAANHWLRNLFYELGSTLASNGHLVFGEIAELKFFQNQMSTVGFCSYLVLNTKLVDEAFVREFIAWLNDEVQVRIGDTRARFPDADSSAAEIDDYINNLYESVEHFHKIASTAPVRSRQKLLKPSTSKKLLVAATARTYQSKTVVANLIYTLIALDECDEALAAAATYASYLDLDQQHHDGYINDILSIIAVYSTCLLRLNPLTGAVYHYNDADAVLRSLDTLADQLAGYLDQFGAYAQIDVASDADDLGFLYTKFNPNVVMSDRSALVDVVSQGWFAVGRHHQLRATHRCSSLELSAEAAGQGLTYMRYALVINATGNPHYLFSYALALAQHSRLKPALKLCKFILKKYPESFKTWNLMTLVLSAFETNKAASGSSPAAHESEKFIDNALNIAQLYMQKNKSRMSLETRYEILQLKLTQLSVLEHIHGVSHILEQLTDVFVLYHELFELAPPAKSAAKKSAVHDSKWSHRPSFIDPSQPKPVSNVTETANGHVVSLEKEAPSRRASVSLDRFKRISRSEKKKAPSQAPSQLPSRRNSVSKPQVPDDEVIERKILQQIWLWTARIYMRVGLADEAEQCLVEAETIHEPNVKTYTALGYLTSGSRKFLALQEFERSLELMTVHRADLVDYGVALLGLAKLFIVDDTPEQSLFISSIDREAGMIRLKNMLEQYATRWGYGSNSPEVWYFLSKVYETVDDKLLLKKALWKCVDLEDYRPTRAFAAADSFHDL